MVSENRSQVKGLLSQGHANYRVGVILNNSRVLKVSPQSAAFCASYLRKTEGRRSVRHPPTSAKVKVRPLTNGVKSEPL